MKKLEQMRLFNDKIDLECVSSVLGSGYEEQVAKLAIEDKVAYRAARKNMQIHSAIILKINDEYMEIYDKNLAHFQITVTSTDNEISLSIEKASLPRERIDAIEKLYNNGFDISVRLSPFIPEYIDFRIINAIKCDKILIEFLKVNHWVKKWFNIDYSKYSLKYGGYEHLTLENKIVLVNKIIGFKEKSVGEYVKDHHDYFSKNVNYNKNDCCNLNFNIKKIFIPKQLTLTYESI